jgi:hypothetical protein
MKGGQPWVWSGAGGLGVAVQPAHWTVSLNSLTASSMSSGVFSGILRARRSVMRWQNRSQSGLLIAKVGWFHWWQRVICE